MKDPLLFFKQTITNNRLSHLYLLSGPKGSAELDLALNITYEILKQSNDQEGLYQQIVDRNHANVFIIEPDGQTIKKEQILLLQKEFSKTSLVKGPRIYIILECEKVTVSAANSLLKFMEEPESSHVYGLLLTSNESIVLQTIISRSQVVKLAGLTELEMQEALVQQNINEDKALILSYLTKDIQKALILAETETFESYLQIMEEILDKWITQTVDVRLLFATWQRKITETKDSFTLFLEMLMILCLDLLHAKKKQPIIFKTFEDKIKSVAQKKAQISIEQLISHIKETIIKQSYYINLDLALDYLALKIERG